MLLQDKVAVITGASRGLGAAIARRFASEGAAVCIAARDQARLDEVAAGIEAQGGVALAKRCDVADARQVEAFAKTVLPFINQGMIKKVQETNWLK